MDHTAWECNLENMEFSQLVTGCCE